MPTAWQDRDIHTAEPPKTLTRPVRSLNRTGHTASLLENAASHFLPYSVTYKIKPASELHVSVDSSPVLFITYVFLFSAVVTC